MTGSVTLYIRIPVPIWFFTGRAGSGRHERLSNLANEFFGTFNLYKHRTATYIPLCIEKRLAKLLKEEFEGALTFTAAANPLSSGAPCRYSDFEQTAKQVCGVATAVLPFATFTVN